MAALSTQSSSSMPHVASHSLSSLKKVLSSRRRSSDLQNNAASERGGIRSSLDSLEKSPSRKSTHSSPSRDGGSSKSGSSGMKKLLPGHAKRKRRRIRDEELKSVDFRGRSQDLDTMPPPSASQSAVSLAHSSSSLFTDDSEQDIYAAPPPLVSRDSHSGYLTTSSPLITTTTIADENDLKPESTSTYPALTDHDNPTVETPKSTSANVSPHTHPISDSTPILPMPGLVDKADTLRPEVDNRSIRRKSIGSSFRGVSPARKIRDVFSSGKSTKSPRTSPDRNYESPNGSASDLLVKTASISERRASKFPDNRELPRVETRGDPQKFKATNGGLPSLETDQPPRTPPSATTVTSLTTVVTPPTPNSVQPTAYDGSPRRNTTASQSGDEQSRVVVSPTGNMISHKRARSAASTSHQPSKLSNSILAPLTTTVEESRAPAEKFIGSRSSTPGGSIFSSWVSAAQNAASTITNTINIQPNNRSRSGTGGSDTKPASASAPASETIKEESPMDEEGTPKKQLAVETLGSGDLDFTHLGLDNGMGEAPKSSIRPDLEDLRKQSSVRRDEAAAKIEDMLARRAVSQAYEKPSDQAQTPIAEVPDPISNIRHATTFGSTLNGESTPPNGSIFDGETGSIKRNNSVRSRLAKHRSRGSSVATGHSTIGAALISASTSTLANPAKGPTLSGFAIAPKQRNRNFHQQFRSVPEDDYLIEDYSCALQKEILLAGRIYISEGHICFSSNILGWVTTLVISFEEVVSIERESTAVVFPNAIAIQTLHARHTFRSLLSREATYDLVIGIWKVSHPAAFKKSVNGKELMEQEASREMAKEDGGEIEDGSEDDDDEDEDESDDGDEGASFVGSDASAVASTMVETKNVTRKPSAMNGAMSIPPSTAALASGEANLSAVATPTGGDAPVDYPGPSIHGPTECTDSSTHYERIVKDEVIPAPLGKIYNLLYGPASGSFLRKYLLEEQKVLELVLEDDKKGLSSEIKSRQYTYIKPLGGSIGPKQTKCITTENLDIFDLEKSISVTCTTQTPDVPSGNAFSVKTRYCLSWAPGNSTRLQMNCGIEWTAKSWLKGPIEKGANDGQQAYGDGLVKILKSGLVRPRAATAGSKGAKTGKKKRKGDRAERAKEKEAEATKKKEEDWGVFEPARGVLRPVVSIIQPAMNGYVATTVIVFLVLLLWFRRPSGTAVGYAGGFAGPAERFAAYDEMWRKEESELWDWLEARVGMDLLHDGSNRVSTSGKKQATRQKLSKGKNAEARLREEKMEEREIEDAIQVTQERLKVLQQAVERKKQRRDL